MNIQEIKTETLLTQIYPDREMLGEEAARLAAVKVNKLLNQKEEINILFAAAPSQNEFLAALQNQDIPWKRINALHMDEYIGLAQDAPQRFGNFLKERIFDIVPFKSIHYLYRENEIPQSICQRYENVLSQYPIDIVFMGIGENGHIAFNDPHVASFNDPQSVKTVFLDEICRMQQVHDGCFRSLSEVPQQAVTVTIPTIMKAQCLLCMVPGIQKAHAVKETLYGPISTQCPASILRTHPQATLFCDKDSASLLPLKTNLL